MKNFFNAETYKKVKTSKKLKQFLCLAIALFAYQVAFAQGGGNAGIEAAASEIKGYVGSITTLSYAIGGVVGLIGGIRVYIKWNKGTYGLGRSFCLFDDCSNSG